MKLPKSIKIRGTSYKIRLLDDVFSDEGEPCHGTCNATDKIIELEKDLMPTQVLEFFLHEWMHAIWSECGLAEEDIPEWIEHIYLVGISKDITANRTILKRLLDQMDHKKND